MGKLIDESLLQEILALIPMEERTFRRTVEELENAPTIEAIPKDQYEQRLKADMVAMLTEIQMEIDELRAKKHFQYKHGQEHGLNDALELIQQKINELEG